MDTGDTASFAGWTAGAVGTHRGERDCERCSWRNVVKCILRHVVSSSSDTEGITLNRCSPKSRQTFEALDGSHEHEMSDSLSCFGPCPGRRGSSWTTRSGRLCSDQKNAHESGACFRSGHAPDAHGSASSSTHLGRLGSVLLCPV